MYPRIRTLDKNPFSRSLFQKVPLTSDSWIQFHQMKLRSTSSADKNFADEITWISWKTKQDLDHSSYSEGDHCPLRLSGLPAAHTFLWVIPQRPAHYFTVHSVGCLQATPSSEWFLKARILFHRSLSEMQLVQDSVKKILYASGFSQKNLAFCSICFVNFAFGVIFSTKILGQFVSDSQFPWPK